MKKLSLVIIALFCLMQANAQEESVESMKKKSDSSNIDTTRMSFGKTKVIIMTDNNYIEKEDTISIKKRKQRHNHFSGLDFGVNGFVNPDMGLNLQKEAEFLDLNYGKSLSIGLNIKEWYIPIAKEKFGIMTGLGFEFNNYDLDRDVVIYSDKDTTFGFIDSTRTVEKNKFKSTMINVPFMLETNIGKDADHSFHLAAGAMISYRLGSKTKMIYEQNGKDFKVKNRNDFNMNPWRISAVARIGYGNFTLFASYSLTELFENNNGPEVYPFTVGISLLTFD